MSHNQTKRKKITKTKTKKKEYRYEKEEEEDEDADSNESESDESGSSGSESESSCSDSNDSDPDSESEPEVKQPKKKPKPDPATKEKTLEEKREERRKYSRQLKHRKTLKEDGWTENAMSLDFTPKELQQNVLYDQSNFFQYLYRRFTSHQVTLEFTESRTASRGKPYPRRCLANLKYGVGNIQLTIDEQSGDLKEFVNLRPIDKNVTCAQMKKSGIDVQQKRKLTSLLSEYFSSRGECKYRPYYMHLVGRWRYGTGLPNIGIVRFRIVDDLTQICPQNISKSEVVDEIFPPVLISIIQSYIGKPTCQRMECQMPFVTYRPASVQKRDEIQKLLFFMFVRMIDGEYSELYVDEKTCVDAMATLVNKLNETREETVSDNKSKQFERHGFYERKKGDSRSMYFFDKQTLRIRRTNMDTFESEYSHMLIPIKFAKNQRNRDRYLEKFTMSKLQQKIIRGGHLASAIAERCVFLSEKSFTC